MPWDLLIRNAQVVTPSGVTQQDLAVENGQIAALSPTLSGPTREELDATGLHLFPGLIDPHVHFNEPGRTDWEGFTTGSSALAAGGGTAFFDMPLNSSPPTLDGPSFDLKLAAAKQNSLTDFALWGGLTPHNLDHLEELADRGVVGFKAFMCDSGIDDFPHADEATLRKGMAIAAKLSLPVAVHAEDQAITARLTAQARAAGRTSYANYVNTRPIAAEVDAIEAAIGIARETGCSLHVVHVSSFQGVNACAFAGHDIGVTCETCPHYLFFSQDDLATTGAALKCAPPLRDDHVIQLMLSLLRGGLIPIIGSDHSPSPPSMKAGDNAFAVWGGIPGVQSTLPAMLTVARNVGPAAMAMHTSTNTARRFRIPSKGSIQVGFDADLTLIDLNQPHTLRREDLLDRHKLSPYVGRTFSATIRRTLSRGQTLFADGRIVSPTHRGRLLTPTRGAPHA